MSLPKANLKQLRGLFNKGLGLNKEFLGTLLGKDSLAEEGQAQQERGAAELRALRAELQADAARAEAAAEEKAQRTAQKAKETADT